MPDRPVGVTILAVLHLIGGILLFGTQFLLWANGRALAGPLETIGTTPAMVIAAMLMLAILAVFSGVGFLQGTAWGWKLGTFYYAWAVVRNVWALVVVNSLADQLDGPRGPSYYVAKHTGRVIVSLLLLLYLHRDNVLEYFNLSHISKPKAIGGTLAYAAVIGAASVTTAWIQTRL